MTRTNPTRAMAAFVAGARPRDLPERVRSRTKTIFLDALANALAGRDADEAGSVIDTARRVHGPGSSTVLGAGTGSLSTATMTNGYLITAVTLCDVHFATLCHVTPEVVPPALAVAEEQGASGEELLNAIALGLEVTTRVGIGLNYASSRARGFHSPGIIGPLGGAAAVASLLGLDETKTTMAFGIATSQAAGTWAQIGTPTIKYQQAHGAVSGLLAGMLASRSFTASDDSLTAPDGGLFSSYSDGGDPNAMLLDLGERWELENISLRPSPAAAFLQGVVTATLSISRKYDLQPGSVRSMRVSLSPTGYALHGAIAPDDRFRARLSARYVAAVVLYDRACWMEQFSAERIADVSLVQFAREHVEIVEDSSVVHGGSVVEILLQSGETLREVARVPKGDPSDPLTFEDVSGKFRAATRGKISADLAERTIESVGRLEDVANVATMLEPLR